MAEQESRRLDVPAAAEYLGISVRYLRKLYQRNEIAHFKLGAKVVFDTDDLDEWLDQHYVAANETG